MPWLLASPGHQHPCSYYVEKTSSCPIEGRISTLYVMSVWRNDTFLMFPTNNWTHKGLIRSVMIQCRFWYIIKSSHMHSMNALVFYTISFWIMYLKLNDTPDYSTAFQSVMERWFFRTIWYLLCQINSLIFATSRYRGWTYLQMSNPFLNLN